MVSDRASKGQGHLLSCSGQLKRENLDGCVFTVHCIKAMCGLGNKNSEILSQYVTNSISYGESSDFSEFTFNPVGSGMALKQLQHNVQFSLP